MIAQTLESDKYICVRQVPPGQQAPELVIVDLKNNNDVMKRAIKADSAIMHWHKQVIALKAAGRTVQIFDLGNKVKLKSHQMNEDIVFWKWISIDTLALVTPESVFHWNVFEPSQIAPLKVFDRNANLAVSLKHKPSHTSSFS